MKKLTSLLFQSAIAVFMLNASPAQAQPRAKKLIRWTLNCSTESGYSIRVRLIEEDIGIKSRKLEATVKDKPSAGTLFSINFYINKGVRDASQTAPFYEFSTHSGEPILYIETDLSGKADPRIWLRGHLDGERVLECVRPEL